MMTFNERWHFLRRAWRYRLRSEKFGIAFLLSRDLRGKTAVDIGANRGIFSYWMHRCVGPDGRVIAFEPQAELAEYLRDLRSCFRLDRLEIASLGLSSQAGQLSLTRPNANWGGASFEPLPRPTTQVEVRPVEVTTLDDYLADHPARPISFIKCDVEGHEAHVFRGARQVLLRDRPDLLFECHDPTSPANHVVADLQQLDYQGFCFARGGFAPIEDFQALRGTMHKKALMDFVFVPAERAAELQPRAGGASVATRRRRRLAAA